MKLIGWILRTIKNSTAKIYSSYKNKSKSINNLISKGYELDLIYQAADDLKLKGEWEKMLQFSNAAMLQCKEVCREEVYSL